MLAPNARTVLDAMAASGLPAIETLSPEMARRQVLLSSPQLQGAKETVAEVRDLTAPSPAGGIPLRLYRGLGCPDTRAPCLVYFHGGGWVVGNIDTHDNICRWIANFAEGIVISVDYRLAPEHPFPAAIEDAAAAWRHVAAEAESWGIDPAQMAAAGDSAGGNIAAVLSLMARNGDVPPVAYQILLYPVTDVSLRQDSYSRYAEGYWLTTAAMRWFGAQYLGPDGDGTDWRVSPLHAPSVAGLAPAFILTAGFDPLHDEARDYAARLRDAGVPVLLDENPGQMHGFLSLDGFIADARASISRAILAWRAATVTGG
jgi:acetyl esterase